MSKLLDQLKSEFDLGRKATFSRLVHVDKQITDSSEEFLTEYKVIATFGMRGYCRKEDIGHIYANCYKQLKSELYEEIQKRIMELEIAIYQEDRKEIDILLREIKREIF